MQEDPTFRVNTDEQTGQVVIAGMGELHLEIIVDRLKREFSVEASVGKPQVAYKETLTRPADGEMPLHRSRPAAAASTAHVKIRLVPARAGHRLRVRERDRRRRDSARVHQADRRGHPGGAARAASSPATRSTTCASSSTTARYHEVDSSEMAFKIAGSMAFQDAAKKAKPVLLEPVMRVEVVVPEGLHGRRHGRPGQPARPHPVAGGPRRHADHQRARAAVGHVRLRDRPAVAHAGPRDLLACTSIATSRRRRT